MSSPKDVVRLNKYFLHKIFKNKITFPLIENSLGARPDLVRVWTAWPGSCVVFIVDLMEGCGDNHFSIGNKGPRNSSGRHPGTRPWQRGLGGFPKPGSRREVSPLESHRQGWTLLSVISSLGRTGVLRHNEHSRTAHTRQQLDCQPRARQRQGQCGSSPAGVHAGGPQPSHSHLSSSPHQSPSHTPPLPFVLPNIRPAQGRHLREEKIVVKTLFSINEKFTKS